MDEQAALEFRREVAEAVTRSGWCGPAFSERLSRLERERALKFLERNGRNFPGLADTIVALREQVVRDMAAIIAEHSEPQQERRPG